MCWFSTKQISSSSHQRMTSSHDIGGKIAHLGLINSLMFLRYCKTFIIPLPSVCLNSLHIMSITCGCVKNKVGLSIWKGKVTSSSNLQMHHLTYILMLNVIKKFGDFSSQNEGRGWWYHFWALLTTGTCYKG